MKVGVLASGAGTNLQALLDTVHGREAEVVAVASDKPDAPALRARARRRASPTRVFERDEFADRAARDAAIADWLRVARRRARRARRLHGAARRRRSSRASATASSTSIRRCCPAFPGIGAIEQAVDYGVQVFGVTVHLVDEGVDTGPIILQRAIELPERDRPDEVHDAPAPARARAAAARRSG